ncbi:MAG: hypothetical protein FRX49_08252 [Trebouxia sp. A1-2]|nr:MAG: hypothetical protein FRX49_08252 [Trebouxia sp. A1-2]
MYLHSQPTVQTHGLLNTGGQDNWEFEGAVAALTEGCVAVLAMASAVEDVTASVAAEAVANSMACSAAAIASMTECVRVNKYSRALDCKEHREVSAQAVRHVMAKAGQDTRDVQQRQQTLVDGETGPDAGEERRSTVLSVIIISMSRQREGSLDKGGAFTEGSGG